MRNDHSTRIWWMMDAEKRIFTISAEKKMKKMTDSAKRKRTDEWLRNVIDILKRSTDHSMDETALYTSSNAKDTTIAMSLICEHPSLTIKKGRVHFEPFAQVSTRDELLHLIKSHFPAAFRRSDLYGLYNFVHADVDELVFKGNLTIVEPAGTIVAVPDSISTRTSPRRFRKAWEASLMECIMK